MKLAFLNEHLLYWNGGIRYIYEVTRRLVSNGNSVDILVTDCSKDNFNQFCNSEVIPIVLWESPSAKNLRYWLLYPYYLLKASLKIKQGSLLYDTFISTSPTSNIWCLLAKIKPIIVVFELNPWLYNKEYVKGLSLLKKLTITIGKSVIKPIDRAAHRNAKAVICHSKYVQSELRRVYNVDSIVVSPGVDTEFFTRVDDNTLHNIYKDYTILLHVASYLNPMKGTKYAIEAMKYIVEKVPNAILLIITQDTKEVQNKLMYQCVHSIGKCYNLNKHITFITDVLDKDMPVYYSLAKVLLQPSFDENAHYPAIEAGCCECPAIGFEGIYDNEDIIEGTTGYIVDRYDSKMMAEAAIDIIRDSSLQGYLGRNARQFMTNKFSWDRCIDKYKELIE